MTRKRRRMILVGLVLLGAGTATALALTAFQDNVLFFYSPSDVAAGKAEGASRFRLGGLVADGSVLRAEDGARLDFTVTDGTASIAVSYRGAVPDLFREGQGVIAHGRIEAGGRFVADELLAKHDETYMPPEVANALGRAGHPMGEGAAGEGQ